MRKGLLDVRVVYSYMLSKSSMRSKKLQLLLYYSYVWMLVILNERGDFEDGDYLVLYDSDIEAWVHGPFIPDLLSLTKPFGWGEIPQVKDMIFLIDYRLKEILDDVWELYGCYSGDELSEMACNELPWIKAREGLSITSIERRIISDKLIYNYYSSKLE